MSSGGGSSPSSPYSNSLRVVSPITRTPQDIIKEILNVDDEDEDTLTIRYMDDKEGGAGHNHVFYTFIEGDERIFKIAHRTQDGAELINKEVEIYRQINAFPEEDKKYFFQGVSGCLSNEQNDQYPFRGYAILVMPFLKGNDLQKILTRKPKPLLTDIYRILKACAEALLIFLRHGISHGDIHLGNIFVLDTGEIKLFDFDSAGDPLGYPLNVIAKPITQTFNITRLKYNTIGVDRESYQRGFFPMCKIIFTYLNKLSILEELNSYKHDISTVDAAIQLYESLIVFFEQKEKESQGGRRRKTKKRMKSRRTRLRRTRVA